MSPWGRWLLIGLGLWIFCLTPAFAQEKPPKKPWTGTLQDGRVITKADLKKIIEDHNLWLASKRRKGNRADLSKAYLKEADLKGAHLWSADLSGSNLSKANLSHAELLATNLSHAHLRGANLTGAHLWSANLSGTDLREADLSNADLLKANLSKAYLVQTNLTGATLREVDLSGAKLLDANLNGARIQWVNLSGAHFEPHPGSLPKVAYLIRITGLDSLTFSGNSSYGLVELRDIYKKSGMRDEERQVTFSLNHTRRKHLWAEKGVLSKLESLFHLFFFEWTCDYGMSPGRPLQIMGLGLLVFIFPYLLALRSRNLETGIWLLLPPDRVLYRQIKGRPFKLSNMPVGWSWPKGDWAWFRANIWLDVRALRLAFYFSLLSAFHIGWRELNVGSWIARLQRREYNLRATGWVRTVSGAQSLMSVYLLALWALSYFGRPFE